MDNVSSVDNISVSDDGSSEVMNFHLVMVPSSGNMSDVSVISQSIFVGFGDMIFESHDVDSLLQDVLSDRVEIVDSVSVDSDLPVSESSVGS